MQANKKICINKLIILLLQPIFEAYTLLYCIYEQKFSDSRVSGESQDD